MPRYQKCCCCVDLSRGAQIFAILGLVSSLLMMTGMNQKAREGGFGAVVELIVESILGVLYWYVLLLGLKKKIPMLVLIWLVLDMIGLVVSYCLHLIQLFVYKSKLFVYYRS